MSEQKYCVVATSKSNGLRKLLDGPMGKEMAERLQKSLLNRDFLKAYKYPKVAKYPYRAKQ